MLSTKALPLSPKEGRFFCPVSSPRDAELVICPPWSKLVNNLVVNLALGENGIQSSRLLYMIPRTASSANAGGSLPQQIFFSSHTPRFQVQGKALDRRRIIQWHAAHLLKIQPCLAHLHRDALSMTPTNPRSPGSSERKYLHQKSLRGTSIYSRQWACLRLGCLLPGHGETF